MSEVTIQYYSTAFSDIQYCTVPLALPQIREKIADRRILRYTYNTLYTVNILLVKDVRFVNLNVKKQNE
jgi:hypothetical protein